MEEKEENSPIKVQVQQQEEDLAAIKLIEESLRKYDKKLKTVENEVEKEVINDTV